MNSNSIYDVKLKELIAEYSWFEDFFTSYNLSSSEYSSMTFNEMCQTLNDIFFEDSAITREDFAESFKEFFSGMKSLIEKHDTVISSLEILPGFNKDKEPEQINLTLAPGQVTAIVGPTGSGKSQLLADIESLASGDTPSCRRIKIDGRFPTDEERFNSGGKMVAQLSQNMNFVMDLPVTEFLTLHAGSRMISKPDQVVKNILEQANKLAGEPFSASTPVTQLSGGQSRSLMIADTAILSSAPIVLIDEIENAGVNKIMALELLIKSNKIVLISTHDPLLALSADQRIVIKNGGITAIIKTTDIERKTLEPLRQIDNITLRIRESLRNGKIIQTDDLSGIS